VQNSGYVLDYMCTVNNEFT